jgi:transcriptional regulator with XRE-family HTH domain
MNSPKQSFGKRLRERRLACGFGLREFASLVEVSSTYISHLEQDKVAPPTAMRTAKIAGILGENSDEWICFAGRIPHDLKAIILKQPTVICALIREANGLTLEQLKKLTELAKR